ncbi:MAG: hypothetical protein HY907_18405 [Deltaproteobacteria bacterium]|nr:hypothetical protein [Deltaproteobacteria bacterium]
MKPKNCETFDRNLQRCTCTYEPCSRKGRCCLCLEYHRNNDELPACFFPPEVERTYDRSAARYLACRGKR